MEMLLAAILLAGSVIENNSCALPDIDRNKVPVKKSFPDNLLFIKNISGLVKA
jgi:hypothetical protein